MRVKAVMFLALLSSAAAAAGSQVDSVRQRAETLLVSDPKAALALLAQEIGRLPAGTERNALRVEQCIDSVISDAEAGIALAAIGLPEARALHDSASESGLLRCEGYAHEQLGDVALAAERYAQAVSSAERSGDRRMLAKALASRGELFQYRGDYDAAIADLKRAYDIDQALGEEAGENYALNAMANLYADPNVGEYDVAIGYYRELLARHERAGRAGEAATALFNLGATYESKHDYAQALANYRQAYERGKQLGDDETLAETQRVIGNVMVKQGQATEALPWIDRSLAYYRARKNADGIARVRLTRGIALRAAGKPAQALLDLQASREYFAAQRNRRFVLRIDEEQALALADSGHWQQAYQALRRQFDAQHAIDQDLSQKQLSRLRVQFETERTQQRNRVLAAENARRGLALQASARERDLQRQILLLGALLLLGLIALATRLIVRVRRSNALALTDELTALPNRRNMLAFVAEQLRTMQRLGTPFCVVAFDIDHFKRINDTHGHDAGDRALRRLAEVASQGLRMGDRLGRTGGEEFLLVLPATDMKAATEIATRLLQSVVAATFDEVHPGQRMSVSLGVARATGKGDTASALLKRADLALYRAKESGRARVVGADALDTRPVTAPVD